MVAEVKSLQNYTNAYMYTADFKVFHDKEISYRATIKNVNRNQPLCAGIHSLLGFRIKHKVKG